MDNSYRASHSNVGHSIGSSGKTFEKTPGQRSSRTGLQKGLMHCSKTLGYGGVILNNAEKDGQHGSNRNTGICLWTHRICPSRKTNKNAKRAKNFRTGLQGGVMPRFKIRSVGGVIHLASHKRAA